MLNENKIDFTTTCGIMYNLIYKYESNCFNYYYVPRVQRWR